MEQGQQYLTFGIERETFAVPVALVQEILDLQPISKLPRAPDYLLGLMDVRGSGVPIIDLRVKLGVPAVKATNRTRVIILEKINDAHQALGLVVDCVFEVSNLGGVSLQAPPSIGQKWRSECVMGIGRRNEDFVIVLNMEHLLASDTFRLADLSAA